MSEELQRKLDAAEAEIARLKDFITTQKLTELFDRHVAGSKLLAQPPAVGEDVVERAKDVIEDWLKQSRFADVDFPGIGARLIAEKLDSAFLRRAARGS